MPKNKYWVYNPNTHRNEFDYDACLQDICQQVNFTTFDGVVKFYEDGVYKRFNKTAFESVLYQFITNIPKLRKEMYEQICSYLSYAKAHNKLPSADSSNRFIAFKNGVLDLETNELLGFSKDYHVGNKLHVNYNPDADVTFVMKALSTWANHNENAELLLQEVLGSAITNNSNLQKSFILLGPPDSGKSSFLEAIQLLVGSDNYSNLQLSDFKKETYLAELFDKLVNCGDDIDNITLKNTGLFKRLVSHNKVIAKQLYEPPFPFEPKATLVFAANILPNIVDKCGDIRKRLVVVSFENSLHNGNCDRVNSFIAQMKTQENLEALALMAVSGLQRLRNNGYQYTEVDCAEEFPSEEDEDPTLFYLRNIVTEFDLVDKPVADAYKAYLDWAKKEAEVPVAKRTFGIYVKRQYGLTGVTKSYINKATAKPVATKIYINNCQGGHKYDKRK